MKILDKIRDAIDRYNAWNKDRENYVERNQPKFGRPWGFHKNKD